MQRGSIRSFIREESGAISPLFAVGILVLVAMAGIGFDYGRVMALDTELQNAADQAALAAATQLDGSSEAITNAQLAATNALGNETRFATGNRQIPSAQMQFEFFEDYDGDAFVGPTTVPEDARVVQVTINPRTVRYALTPLVGAITGNAMGRAAATLGSATCNVTPMFFCVPRDGAGNNILTFPEPDDIGKQMKLHLRNNASEAFTPGNFGFLDVPWGTNSQKNIKLGLNTGAAGCFTSTPDQQTETGSRTPMGRSLNSRLDVYDSSMRPSDCNDSTGNFCPSQNVTKNWVNVQEFKNPKGTEKCASNPLAKDWIRYDSASGIPNPGYPDDSAFSGPLGNGEWAPETWLSINHPSNALSEIPDEDGNGRISRYEAFLWELGDPDLLKPYEVHRKVDSKGGLTLYCAYPKPVNAPPGVPASDDQKDRRVLTVGTVACADGYPNGSKPVRILRWVDLFLVKPVNTASDTEFYTEIIGSARQANGDSGFQYFDKRKAVLIR